MVIIDILPLYHQQSALKSLKIICNCKIFLGKPNVLQNVIFLSDGESRDDIVAPAENFHANGIRITSVLLGHAKGMEDMKKIIGSNRTPALGYKNHYFESKNAADLALLAKKMREEILECE